MVTDSRIQKAIDGITDREVKKAFVEHLWRRDYPPTFFRDHESAFRRVFPKYFDTVRDHFESDYDSVNNVQVFLLSFLCIELGVVDLDDPSTVKNFLSAGISSWHIVSRYGDMGVDAFFFEPSLKKGRFTRDGLVKFLQAESEYLNFFLPLMCAYDDRSMWSEVVEFVKSAKLEDTLRVSALYAMLTTKNRTALEYFISEIESNNFYRLKAMNEAAALIDSSVSLKPKDVVKIIKDAATCDPKEYLDKSFAAACVFIRAVDHLRKSEFPRLVELSLEKGAPRVRWAMLYTLSEGSVNGAYAKLIFAGSPLSLEDLSFFEYKIHAKLMDKKLLSVVFDNVYAAFAAMDKVSYHFKTDSDITFARDVSKSVLVKILAEIAVLTGNKDYVNKLDSHYETMREEAQSKYLGVIGKLTKLDARACTVRFLKTDNYDALKFYEEQKLTLTYDEAVVVSDYLKSKKQNVKTKIIKEFMRSPDRDKIADYLLSAPEDYKQAAGKEIDSSKGKTRADKLEEQQSRYYWNTHSVYEVKRPDAELSRILDAPPKFTPIEALPLKKFNKLCDAVDDFIKRNASYEYTSMYGTVYTLGSNFCKLSWDDDSYDCVPLGGELKNIVEELDERERAALCMILYSVSCGRKSLAKVFDKSHDAEKEYDRLNKYSHNYGAANAWAALKYIMRPMLADLSESVIVDAILTYTSKKNVERFSKKSIESDKDNSNAERYSFSSSSDFIPYEFFNAVDKTTDRATLEAMAYSACAFVKCGVEWLQLPLFAKLVDGEYISEELAEYVLVSGEHNITNYFHHKSDNYIMRADYPYAKFKKFLLGFTDKALFAEFSRGNLTLPTTVCIRTVGKYYGVKYFLHAIAALRGITWARSSWGSEKDAVLSHILKSAVKAENDTYEDFLRIVKQLSVTEEELLRAMVFNPEFVDYTSKYLNVPRLDTAIYWFVAHLNETLYGDERERREEKLKQYSDISYPDFQDGAFDARWYKEMTECVPEKTLSLVYKNAKYVTVGGLHKRAQRFFDAVGGRIQKQECLEKINSTRNKDYCLIYSLIPVTDKNDLRERYLVLSEFLRESKQFGAQRQASERRTVDIALENLARTAGYSDVNIFIFEMEADSPSDIYRTYSVGDVEITPYIDDRAFKINYTVMRDGKKLSSVPSKFGKDKTLVELRESIKELNEKFRRIVNSFEQAMCNRVPFTVQQLESMCRERIISVVLSKLLLLADGKLAVFDGKLRSVDGKELSASEVYVAHPVELKQKGLLHDAVSHVVSGNIKQPFKQALREIYTRGDGETGDEVLRFKGFNVDVKKCVAALKGKDWGVSEDVGVRKVYYRTDTIAALFREFDFPYTADFGNLNRELHGVFFYNRKTGDTIKIEDVDAVTFSETLRDVDLVITISANGIYDFELAKSTAEIRREILKSIVEILGLKNVSLLKENIRVEGYYGTYVINIRTGLVFKEGKGNLMLDTVYSTDKPILLDFIDEDPMTADVISKAIVLADDKKIRDSAVLREIKDN